MPQTRLRRWRHHIRGSRTLDTTYRLVVAVVGGLVVVAGLVMLVLPGPGWAAIFVGLAILSTEFAWARRLSDRIKQAYARVKRRALDPRVRRRNQMLAGLLVVAAAAAAGAYVWTIGLRAPF